MTAILQDTRHSSGKPFLPSENELPMITQASRQLGIYLQQHGEENLLFVPKDGDEREHLILPASVMRLFQELLKQLASGNAVKITPYHAMLTTQQAADFLGVSRPFLVKLLDAGDLSHEKVGTHRRVAFQDIVQFKENMLQKRRNTLDALTQATEALGLEGDY